MTSLLCVMLLCMMRQSWSFGSFAVIYCASSVFATVLHSDGTILKACARAVVLQVAVDIAASDCFCLNISAV